MNPNKVSTMSGIKLRQAFRALQDDDFDGVGRIELDEQGKAHASHAKKTTRGLSCIEQEQLIQRLQNQNQQSDAWFTVRKGLLEPRPTPKWSSGPSSALTSLYC